MKTLFPDIYLPDLAGTLTSDDTKIDSAKAPVVAIFSGKNFLLNLYLLGHAVAGWVAKYELALLDNAGQQIAKRSERHFATEFAQPNEKDALFAAVQRMQAALEVEKEKFKPVFAAVQRMQAALEVEKERFKPVLGAIEGISDELASPSLVKKKAARKSKPKPAPKQEAEPVAPKTKPENLKEAIARELKATEPEKPKTVTRKVGRKKSNPE
jgi:hypothetical protein